MTQRTHSYQQTKHQQPNHNKVFLAGLAFYFTEADLYRFFDQIFRSVVKIDLVKNRSNKRLNRGCGFIQFADPAEARTMLETEFYTLAGRTFCAKEFIQGKALEQHKKDLERRRIFMHSIDPKLSNKQIKAFFDRFVPIEDAYVITKDRYKLTRKERERLRRRGVSSSLDLRYGYLVVREAGDAERLLDIGAFEVGRSHIILVRFDPKKHVKESEESGDEFRGVGRVKKGRRRGKKQQRGSDMARDPRFERFDDFGDFEDYRGGYEESWRSKDELSYKKARNGWEKDTKNVKKSKNLKNIEQSEEWSQSPAGRAGHVWDSLLSLEDYYKGISSQAQDEKQFKYSNPAATQQRGKSSLSSSEGYYGAQEGSSWGQEPDDKLKNFRKEPNNNFEEFEEMGHYYHNYSTSSHHKKYEAQGNHPKYSEYPTNHPQGIQMSYSPKDTQIALNKTQASIQTLQNAQKTNISTFEQNNYSEFYYPHQASPELSQHLDSLVGPRTEVERRKWSPLTDQFPSSVPGVFKCLKTQVVDRNHHRRNILLNESA